MKTITVQNCFGDDKQINQKDFVQRWTDHIKEIASLKPSLSEQEITRIRSTIFDAATAEFKRIAES